jgi:phosphoglycerate dehydrogenase-like enzyme
MKHLKLIQIASAGYSQLVGLGLRQRRVNACNALGVFDVPIAEWNIAMMINLRRDLRTMIRNQESKNWDRSACFQKEIRGCTVGIWGYGGIGRETARLAKLLGMKVHVMTRNGVKARKDIYCVPGTGDIDGKLPDRIFTETEKEDFLNSLDFLIMAVPQTKTTTGIIGEAELKMLQPHAFILNPARGPLIQEQPFLQSLINGNIAGAAVDTHYYYPMPKDHPLWSLPNVIMTPHISGSSSSNRFLERVWEIFVLNVDRFLKDQLLLNQIEDDELL